MAQGDGRRGTYGRLTPEVVPNSQPTSTTFVGHVLGLVTGDLENRGVRIGGDRATL